MYVTDVPVIDRLTDPVARALAAALEKIEDMTADLLSAADCVAGVAEQALECDDIECDEPHASNLGKSLDHLSGCTESVLAAQQAIREALALSEIHTA